MRNHNNLFSLGANLTVLKMLSCALIILYGCQKEPPTALEAYYLYPYVENAGLNHADGKHPY